MRAGARCGVMAEARALVEVQGGRERTVGFQEQFAAFDRAIRAQRAFHQQPADAAAADRGIHRHLRQLVDAVALVLERDGADDAIVFVDREQYMATVGQDVRVRVRQHFAIDGFDDEILFEPLDVQAREIRAPARIEIDDADHSWVRCATAAVAASRSLSTKGTIASEAIVPASRQRTLTSTPSGWLRGM